jgi:hypothetical protein
MQKRIGRLSCCGNWPEPKLAHRTVQLLLNEFHPGAEFLNALHWSFHRTIKAVHDGQ